MSSLSYVYVGITLSACLALYSFRLFNKNENGKALFYLTLSALVIRFCIASSDSFLYDWDEKFHALVAKNMCSNPFKPMLFLNPILPSEVKDWCCNHIWTHKPPLFLWFMALSIKTFGVKVISIRIPSILFGSLIVPIIYDISQQWIKDHRISFLAALLYAFSFYQIELISGRIALDHNDVIFQFLVIASIWAFIRYNNSKTKPLVWATIIGLLSGAAILTKWLVGLLVYFGWAVHILIKKKYHSFKYFSFSLLISTFIALPWQLYILHTYPSESNASYSIFYKHITDALGTNLGDNFYHLLQLNNIYDYTFFLFIIWGMYTAVKNKYQHTIALLSMISVVYVFFSLIVNTKMPSFPIIVSPLIWILISVGITSFFDKVKSKYKIPRAVIGSMLFLFTVVSLKPWDIIHHRSNFKKDRLINVYNSNIYKNIEVEYNPKNVIINCKAFDNIDIMFFNGIMAYPSCPEPTIIDSLSSLGYRFYAFDSHKEYLLPEAIRNHPNVTIINKKLK